MDLNLTEILGITGAALVLVAFAMNQSNKWTNDSYNYDLTNFIGSAMLLLYGLILETYPFVALNAIWALFSLKDLLVRVSRK